MQTFTEEFRFCSRTGKPLPSEWVPSFTEICDYSGIVISDKCGDPLQDYMISEISGMEETWYEDDIFFNDARIDMRALFANHRKFIYAPSIKIDDPTGRDENNNFSAEKLLVMEWVSEMHDDKKMIKEFDKIKKLLGFSPDQIFTNCETIGCAMYAARYRVIRKLISDGWSLEKLGLETEER